MAEPLPEADLDTAVDPDRIQRQDFEIERRGFDQRQVRAYLIAVAESLRDAQAREADMRMRMGRAVRRAESAEKAARESQTTSADNDVARQVGDEVAGVLDAARVAGEQRLAAAESSAQQILANAKTEASELRGAAETVLAERSDAADTAAAAIVAEGEQQAEQIRDQARHDHERARRHAIAMVGKARSESDSLVNEAEQARAQILEDMDRRRREARAQVERLRVGRDRLLRSYEVVRRSLDEATNELKISLTEAKVRGDSAARRVVGEPPAPHAQLEAEVADAKMTGLIRIEPQADEQPRTTPESAAPEARDEPPTTEPTPAVPNIDLRTRNQSPATFAERVTPSPSRPRVGAIETNDPAIRVVPKPPVIAPIIRREEPVASAEVEGRAEAEVAPVDAESPAAEVAEVTALLVEAGVDSESADTADVDTVVEPAVETAEEQVDEVEVGEHGGVADDAADPQGDAAAEDTEADAVDETADVTTSTDADADVDVEADVDVDPEVVEAELSEEELDAVFAAELPRGELAIVSAADEIETVTPLIDDEVDATLDVAVEAQAEVLAEDEAEEEVDVVDLAAVDTSVEAQAELLAEDEAEEEAGAVDLAAVDTSVEAQAEVLAEDEVEATIHAAVEAEADGIDEAAPDASVEDDAPAQHATQGEEDDEAEASAPAGGLFAALRQQRSEAASDQEANTPHIVDDADPIHTEKIRTDQTEREPEAAAASAEPVERVDETRDQAPPATAPIFEFDIDEVYRQRDAVVAESANQLERRLKRALADEQNELLASVRASKKKSVELISVVGDSDEHLSRYVTAIAEVATTAYSAGMALVQTDVTSTATLPAGAVEELIVSSIIDPIRRRLEVAGSDEPETQLSTVRAFYRQRKTDDLPAVAADLASLLCTAGLCETLPPGTPLPR